MKGTIAFFTIMLVILAYSVPAFARGGSHRPGPVHAQDGWPTGLVELLNRDGRVNGYFVNANDFFFFAGDTEAFNEFIKQYATLKNTPLRLILYPGVGMTGSLSGEKDIPFEWKVSAERWHSDPSDVPTLVTIELRLGGLVQLDKIKIPPNVEVKSGGEIEAFVAEHEAKRKVGPRQETTQSSPEMVETTGRPSGIITTGEPDTSAESPDRQEAPDFSLQALNGKTIKLADFRGKVVILNFWATWVPQCMREMATLEELYRGYQENLVVLGVSVDSVDSDNTDAVKAYVEERKVTYPILIAPREMLYDYEIACESPIETIPTTIIIDERGFIHSQRVGVQRQAALKRSCLSSSNASGQGLRPEHPRTESIGPVNRVLSLDGERDYVEVPDSASLDLAQALTVEMWVQVSSLRGGDVKIFLNKEDAYECGITSTTAAMPPQNFAFALSINGDFASPENATGWYDGRQRLEFGRWYHVAFIYNGELASAYVDGLLTASYTAVGSVDPRETTLRIGARSKDLFSVHTSSVLLHGQIDEVRIWNIARTQEQIQTTMNTTLTGNEEGLVGYWNFDDGTAVDLSLSGNDGFLHGDAQIVAEMLPDEFIHQGVSIVSVENKIANPGDQFISVNISGSFAEAIRSFSFDLTFDSSVLMAVGVKGGPTLMRDSADIILQQAPTIDNKNGLISGIRCNRMGVVTFNARNVGSSSLTIRNLSLLSPAGEEIQAYAKHGKVDVYAHGSIAGVVLNSTSQKPIEGVKVEVLKDGFSFGLPAYSGKDGKYTIKNVPVGTFDLRVYRDEYLPEIVEKVQVKRRETTPNVKLMMAPLQSIDGFGTNPWER